MDKAVTTNKTGDPVSGSPVGSPKFLGVYPKFLGVRNWGLWITLQSFLGSADRTEKTEDREFGNMMIRIPWGIQSFLGYLALVKVF